MALDKQSQWRRQQVSHGNFIVIGCCNINCKQVSGAWITHMTRGTLKTARNSKCGIHLMTTTRSAGTSMIIWHHALWLCQLATEILVPIPIVNRGLPIHERAKTYIRQYELMFRWLWVHKEIWICRVVIAAYYALVIMGQRDESAKNIFKNRLIFQ